MNRKIKIIVAAASTFLALGFVSCGKKKGAAKGADDSNEQIFAVGTYITKEGNLDDYLEFGGDVASVNEIAVLPDMAGKVSRVAVSVGDMVSKNQVIAYVDASRAGMTYSASPVRSPIAGRIISLPVTVGTTVAQSSPVATVARTDELEVKINIAERFISRVSLNQTAIVTFDAYPGIEFPVTVKEVSPVLDTLTRTMQVKLKFNKKDERIKVGMYARVKLITESVQNAIVIPSNAILTRDGKTYVFVVKNGIAYQESVESGISIDNKTEITKGLSSGDEIIIKGQALLNDGVKVNVISTSK
ncbi:MAG: efflux RND transporter periplasmic adaptor subunit [Treponema sp.]|nr:efflux RND transporter periplasmic adaptor subunit [Treponema sp.]